MKRYRITYFLGQAFKGLWRNGLMTIASITVLMSCLVVMGSFGLLIFNIDVNLENLGNLNEIVVFVDETKTDEDVALIEANIRALDNVADVKLVTKEQALDEERAKYQEQSELYDLVDDDNPLRDELHITYKNNSEVPSLVVQLQRLDGVANVNNRLDLSVMIERVKNSISLVLIWFMVILLAVSIFVIINTIKLAVHSRRAEITIMRYIGATDWFVVLPFIFEGIIIGVVSAVLGFFIEWGLYDYVIRMMDGSFEFIELLTFGDVSLLVGGVFLAIGIVTGIIGSTISTRKHLRA